MGQLGFSTPGRWEVDRAPQNLGAGVGKRAQLTGPLLRYYEGWRQRRRIFFSALKMVNFFFTKYMANDDFSDPPQCADSKNPIFIFCRILGGSPPGPGGSVLVGFWGASQLGLARGLYRPPPPPRVETPPTLVGGFGVECGGIHNPGPSHSGATLHIRRRWGNRERGCKVWF